MNSKLLMIILIPAIVTFLIRATPFVFFSNKRLPNVIVFLGNYLPYAMMGLLVVYSLKEISLFTFPFGLSEIISALFVMFLYKAKRNMLISIAGGTILYMFFEQFLFV